MKKDTLIEILVLATAAIALAGTAGYYHGYARGHKQANEEAKVWKFRYELATEAADTWQNMAMASNTNQTWWLGTNGKRFWIGAKNMDSPEVQKAIQEQVLFIQSYNVEQFTNSDPISIIAHKHQTPNQK